MVTPSDRKKNRTTRIGDSDMFRVPSVSGFGCYFMVSQEYNSWVSVLMGSISLLRFFFLGQVFR